MSEEDQNLSYLYWTPQTAIQASVYSWLQYVYDKRPVMPPHQSTKYHKGWIGVVLYTKTSRNGVNNMWILKNSTSVLSLLDQFDVRTATSVQTFDFTTLYTSIAHNLLKSRISNLVHNPFRKKDGSVRYTHIKVTRSKGYSTHDINGGEDNMHTADNICKMIEVLIDNILVQFGWCLFRQVIGIPMRTNCAPLLADLFLNSYEKEFLNNMIRSGHMSLGQNRGNGRAVMGRKIIVTCPFTQIAFSLMYSAQISVFKQLCFKTGQHFDQSKLVSSGTYLSSSCCMPILFYVQQVIPLFCRQKGLFLSLPARTMNKTG